MNNWIPPHAIEELREIEKYQAERKQEEENHTFVSNKPSPNYVLIDAALWGTDIDAILENRTVAHKSLFRGSVGLELWSVAPYIVDVGSNDELAKAIKKTNKKDPIERRVTWLYSTGNADDLRKHFRRFLRMKQGDGSYIYSRFYDPYVANTVFPNFTKEQALEFFKGVMYIETEDVRIGKKQIFYLSREKDLRIISQKTD